MKKFLIVYYGDTPECVEGFKKDCKRSCKGTLYIKPGRQMTVTEDELNHVKEKHKHVLPKLRILAEHKPNAKKVEAKKNVAPVQKNEEAKEDNKPNKKVSKKVVKKANSQQG